MYHAWATPLYFNDGSVGSARWSWSSTDPAAVRAEFRGANSEVWALSRDMLQSPGISTEDMDVSVWAASGYLYLRLRGAEGSGSTVRVPLLAMKSNLDRTYLLVPREAESEIIQTGLVLACTKMLEGQ